MTDQEQARHEIRSNVMTALQELSDAGHIKAGHVLVIGTSTSEVMGKKIGTSGGSQDIAKTLFEAIISFCEQHSIYPAFQCCEHLNRSVVVERSLQNRKGWTEVMAVPVPQAGGSMASYAYGQLNDACLVESVEAEIGMDIGQTLIGMHLRSVAVPFRPTVKKVGAAPLVMAYTRPKLIGGVRAVYSRNCD